MWRMRSRGSEDSLVGSTTLSSFPSLAAAAASSVAWAASGADGEAVEDDRTAMFVNLRAERDWLATNPSR